MAKYNNTRGSRGGASEKILQKDTDHFRSREKLFSAIPVPQLTWVDQREKRYPLAWEKVPPLEMWVVVTKWLPNCNLDTPMGRQQIWATFRQQMLTYQKVSNFQNFIRNIPSNFFFDGETLFLSYQRFLVNFNKPIWSIELNESNMNISCILSVSTHLFGLYPRL